MFNARRGCLLVLTLSLAGCEGDSTGSTSTPVSGPTGGSFTTPTPSIPSTPQPTPTPTPTPAPLCRVSVGPATFDPSRINCPSGNSPQTLRISFDVAATGDTDISINRVTSFGANCRIGAGTACTWADAPLGYSPSLVPRGQTTRITATQTFNCNNGGGGGGTTAIELHFQALFVNTSCGSFESEVKNFLEIRF